MHEPIIWVIRIHDKIVRAHTEIPFLAKVCISFMVEEDPHTNIELPLVDQQGPFDILLNYKAIMLIFWLK
jgi:hypothetical protein